MAKPTDKPEWATADITLSSGTANKVRPQSALRTNGYDVDEEPTAQELNWQLNNIYRWIDNLDIRITTETLALADVYPIGSIYANAGVATNPATLLGFGTWVAYGAGRVMVGVGTTGEEDAATYALNDEGGEETHGLTVAEMPAHSHTVPVYGDNSRNAHIASAGTNSSFQFNRATSSVGSGQAHNNIQPYVAVHMWRRTA